jgi:O-antigen/teichoic acid export membrane protein
MIVSYLLSSGSLASASLAQLATFAILARALGPAEFGLLVQISAVTAIGVQICGLGASDCLLRRVSREPGSYPILLGHNLLLIGLTGIVLMFGGVATMSSWAPFHSRPDLDVWTIALLFFSNVVLVRLIVLVETIFLGLGRVRSANRSVVGFALARTATAALACSSSAPRACRNGRSGSLAGTWSTHWWERRGCGHSAGRGLRSCAMSCAPAFSSARSSLCGRSDPTSTCS